MKFYSIFALLFLAIQAQAQTVFIDDLSTPAFTARPVQNFELFHESSLFSPLSDSYLPGHLAQSLSVISSTPQKSCEDKESYHYALALTASGRYMECADYVEKCLQQSAQVPIATVIQGARCAKSEYQYARTYALFSEGLKSSDFKSEHASALILEFALFAQFSVYSDKTDSIIDLHPSWTTEQRDTVKSLVEFLGKTQPIKKTKDQVLAFVREQISNSADYYQQLLKVYRMNLLLNEALYDDAYNYLVQDARTLENPLDWWPLGFKILYRISQNADFSKSENFYRSFFPFAHDRSFLPLEENPYNYTQIYESVCHDHMLQGQDLAQVQSDLKQWKNGALSTKQALEKMRSRADFGSGKSDLLSTYAGLLVIDNQPDSARQYYWQSTLACPFNNRAHWGLLLLERKKRYASFPEFQTNILKLKEVVSQIRFPTETSSYFINWRAFPEVSQERIKYGARIWAPYIGQLTAENYKTYIKMPFELLSASPGLEQIRDRRIGPPDMPTYHYDNRLWDDVRGLGGATVIADHDETFETVQGDYNLLGHEMAHQFHNYLRKKKPVLADCIEKLYAAASAAKQFPDSYAAQNSAEYFAQGITYYLIPADAPARYGINSAWYPKNDSKLYEFMNSIERSGGDVNRITCPL